FPPHPGLLTLVQPRSCVRRPVVKGVPTLIPWPGIVTQLTPSFRPAAAQLLFGLMPRLITPLPGNWRYVAAMLPAGARASKAWVSYHPLPVRLELGSRTVS